MVNKAEFGIEKKRITALEKTVGTLVKELNETKAKTTALEERCRKLEEENIANTNEIRTLKEKASNSNTTAADFWSKLPKAAANVISNLASKESIEVTKKERNLIMFGVKESTLTDTNERNVADQTAVKTILAEIGIESDEIEEIKIKRFKSKESGKPGQILMECDSKETKMSILKAAKNLKNNTAYKSIYINNDLTHAQLELEKKLRKERNEKNSSLPETGPNNLKYGLHVFGDSGVESKFYWGIRNGELKKIKVL
jgi:hypothetical protein